MYRYESWLKPTTPTFYGETREAMRLLPSYGPEPVRVHRIEWTRKKRVYINRGAQVAAAWEAVVGTMPIDDIFKVQYRLTAKNLE